MSKGSPRIEFRLPSAPLRLLNESAAARKQSAAVYAKSLVIAALASDDDPKHSADLRLEVLAQSIEQMRDELRSTLQSVVVLAGAAVASSALLRDDETQPTQVAQEKVGKHVRVALVAAPSVVELFRKS